MANWILQMLASGTLSTTSAELFNPRFPCVVRGVRVSNQSGVAATLTINATTLGGSVPLSTPSLPLLANESVLLDTPIMLSAETDAISGVGSTSTGLTYVIWGVTKQ